MSETELSVICKNCGSEVSPYVTECPYCGARLRKRAPKLERHGDVLEPKPGRRKRRRRPRLPRPRGRLTERPYATLVAIGVPVALLLVQRAGGLSLTGIGGLAVPLGGEWWRLFTASFAYSDVGYLFVVGLAMAIFSTGVERRLGSIATAVLLVACGALAMLAAAGLADLRGEIVVAGGGNGVALGALAAWFALRRAEARRAVDEDYDQVAVAVAAAVLLALPIFESSADAVAGLAGGAVGALAGLLAATRWRMP